LGSGVLEGLDIDDIRELKYVYAVKYRGTYGVAAYWLYGSLSALKVLETAKCQV
jgi:hypothetical protein